MRTNQQLIRGSTISAAAATGRVHVISWRSFRNGITFARGEELENVSYSDIYCRWQYLNHDSQTCTAKPPAEYSWCSDKKFLWQNVKLLNQLTDFNETWYENVATGVQPNIAFFKFFYDT